MSAAVKIAQWVEKKPLILIRFDEDFSKFLLNSRQGFEHLTIVKPHRVFQELKIPTLCLLEIRTTVGPGATWARQPEKTPPARLTHV